MSASALEPAETIAAISTAAGEGAIALVRLSGANALIIADAIFRGKISPTRMGTHTQHLGEIIDGTGHVLDQVMLSVHLAPHSYTGEHLVEISCHGGSFVSAKVLEACLKAGARSATPGEFTERAYWNDKIDVTQAEAVIDVIRARTDLALRAANEQLSGQLGTEFRQLRERVVSLLAHIEASLDFAEEGIAPDDTSSVRRQLKDLATQIDRLLATAETGRILREGLRIVIFGATNAGKSSLLNRLVGFDRAIVHETHGTTRDTIEEQINLRGIALRLLDTAGLRVTDHPVEREGIARTTSALENADLRLHIVDASAARPGNFELQADEILVLNKSDLAESGDWSSADAIRISCITGAGLQALEDEIFRRIDGAKLNAEHPLAINARHREHLHRAYAAVERAATAIDAGATPEMFAVDLQAVQRELDELLGDANAEAVRDAIFSQFCIGK